MVSLSVCIVYAIIVLMLNGVFTMAFSQVGVEKISLNGRVRMTLKPLMDEMPIVAAIQV